MKAGKQLEAIRFIPKTIQALVVSMHDPTGKESKMPIFGSVKLACDRLSVLERGK